jgi:maleylacetate reductase
VAVDTRAAMHVPAPLADAVRADVARAGADLLVAVGGGSPVGMAKAVALAGGPPIVAVPTTYAGSEMTPIWGVTRGGAKETGRDERVRPRAVLYDPALTLDLPPRVAGPSALNAAAHAVEALYAPDASPLVALAAAEGLRALAAAAPRVVRAPADLAARTEALYGAWLAGLALGASTMGLHHKLCHVLGGAFGLPHAETHAVVLPHAAAYNAPAAAAAMAAAAGALGAGDAPAALHALAADVAAATGAPASLRALGLREADLDRAAAAAAAHPYPNPRPVTARPCAPCSAARGRAVRPTARERRTTGRRRSPPAAASVARLRTAGRRRPTPDSRRRWAAGRRSAAAPRRGGAAAGPAGGRARGGCGVGARRGRGRRGAPSRGGQMTPSHPGPPTTLGLLRHLKSARADCAWTCGRPTSCRRTPDTRGRRGCRRARCAAPRRPRRRPRRPRPGRRRAPRRGAAR